jgi:hypothetical protein
MPMLWITATIGVAGMDATHDVALSISEEKRVRDLVSLLIRQLQLPTHDGRGPIAYDLRIDHGDGTMRTPIDSDLIRDADLRMGDVLTLEQNRSS